MSKIKTALKQPIRYLLQHKILIVPLVGIAVLGFVLWPKPKNEPLQYATVQRQDVNSSVSASGVLSGKDDVNLHFNSSGKLGSLNVKAGDRIQKGDQVAALDMQQLNINLTQAQNNLKSAQATVDKVLDDIHLYQSAGLDPNRTDETQTQRQARTAAQVTRDNAVDSVKAAKQAFGDALLFAPLSGVVTKADPIPGQNITPADTIVQIVDDSQIQFAADVDESDIAHVALNQPVNVTLNAYPNQTFYGFVSDITPVTKTITSGATVVAIKVNLQNPTVNFVVGLNGQAEIVTQQAKKVLTVPLEALRDDNTVYLKDGKGTKLVPVHTGIKSDSQVEITDGLKEGDQVVTNPQAVKSK